MSVGATVPRWWCHRSNGRGARAQMVVTEIGCLKKSREQSGGETVGNRSRVSNKIQWKYRENFKDLKSKDYIS